MITIDWKPSVKTLRQFGWIALGGFGLAGGLVAWKTGAVSGTWPWALAMGLWGLALLCPVLALVKPELLRFIYVPLMVVVFPIGFVLGTIMMLLIFFLIFTPLALWFKIARRDALKRSTDPEASSYWEQRGPPPGPERYYRQY
jgi:hypothetical protein